MTTAPEPETPKITLFVILDGILLVAAAVVSALWLAGRPAFYSDVQPVMSVFTSFSLLVMAGVRLARRFFYAWPMALSLALVGMVLGGNLSSLLMLTSVPPELMQSFPDVVMTSVMTSIGLILFCLYEIFVELRPTPRTAFILDDILIHLALVPGGLSLLGYLLENPGYLSIGLDPRVGISPLEMAFMGTYACAAVLSNPDLFLWRFLAAGWANRIIFAGLFANQFIAPLLVAYAFYDQSRPASGPGLELFVMLAGVATTMSFLLIQAYLSHNEPDTAAD